MHGLGPPFPDLPLREQLGDAVITQNKAAGDLRRMVELGMLKAHGAGRGSRYSAGPRIDDIANAP